MENILEKIIKQKKEDLKTIKKKKFTNYNRK